ncbi:MAG: CapA family protein [Ilumatobacteraceae bacterium]
MPPTDRLRRLLLQLVAMFLVATSVALFVRFRLPNHSVGAQVGGGDADAAAAEPVGSLVGADGGRPLTIVATGEILPHPSVVEHTRLDGAATGVAYDFAPMFADIAPIISAADLAICHLEVPVAPEGTPLSGYPDFAIPPEVAAGIAATGWDRCSTVSNHSNDRGAAGRKATLDALDAAGVGHSGTARAAAEAAEIPLVDVHGVPVAHLAYTWGFNGSAPKSGWMANVIDPDRILADAAAARAAGAQVVVVSLHWGDEYDREGSDAQRGLADRLLASPDIDLIIGHGPHVLQPIEQFHGKWALMSLGNLVANQGPKRPLTFDSVVASITFHRGADGQWAADSPIAYPTWYDAAAGTVRLLPPSPHDDARRVSLERTRAVMGDHLTRSD